MCLLSFQWQPDSDTPLIMVANRDEFHARPALSSAYWPDDLTVFAGKDLQAGGTWMGVTRSGRFAALTNVRQIPAPYKGSVSRGHLVIDYLKGNEDAERYLKRIASRPTDYDGFNLVLGDVTACWYLSNRNGAAAEKLAPGLYGLSNAQLNTPWPKVEYAKQRLNDWVSRDHQPDYADTAQLARLLSRRDTYPFHQLPNTGIGKSWETLLSSPFIISESYGTRASTGLVLTNEQILWEEVSFDEQGDEQKVIQQTIEIQRFA